MIASSFFGLLTGMLFGVALYKVGAVRYSRVVGMITLRDCKVMKFAFTAIAFTSMVYGLAAIMGVASSWNLVPRVMPFTGWSHLIGGVIFGTTMAVTGYCPGACMARFGHAAGIHRFAPISAIIGLFVGILIYSVIKMPLIDAGIIMARPQAISLYGLMGVSYGAMALAFAVVMTIVTLLVDRFLPEKIYQPAQELVSFTDRLRGEWHWLPAGILASCAIILSTVQGGYLGFSGSILASTAFLADLIGVPIDMLVPKINSGIIWRVGLFVGLFPGAYLASLTAIPAKGMDLNYKRKKVFSLAAIIKAFVAGNALSVGAMVGGGCTTGAFMAAFPTLSLGSFAMAGTFFVVAMAWGFLLYTRDSSIVSELQSRGNEVYD